MKTNKIGGYFGIELDKKEEYHKDAIRLNSGRSCLDYILKLNKFNKVYLPFYSCNSILEIIIKNNLKYEFYSIDTNLLPTFNGSIAEDEAFLFINFFGLNNANVGDLRVKYKNIIVDNCQAFFEIPSKNVYAFYSPRKFFGVSDGGYLYSADILRQKLKEDYSTERCHYMLLRSEGRINDGYLEYKKNEELFNNYGIRQMSKLTQNILSSIDYAKARQARNENFYKLHVNFKESNKLKINKNLINGAIAYPLLITNGQKVRSVLKENGIFCATYWKEVLGRVSSKKIEFDLVNNLVTLPIDQRYDLMDMAKIVKIINKYA